MKRINLIPQEKRKTPLFLTKGILRLVLVTSVILITFITVQAVNTIRLKIVISSRRNNISALEQGIDKYQELYQQIKAEKENILRQEQRIEDKISAIKKIQQQRFNWAMILEDISKIAPQGVSLNSVSLSKERIAISGTTLDNLNVSKFMQLLDDSDNFRDTNFLYTRKETVKDKKEERYYEVINFGLTSHLEGADGF